VPLAIHNDLTTPRAAQPPNAKDRRRAAAIWFSRMASIDESLAAAIRHHQAGQFREAEHIYREILGIAPGHSDAWHLWGVVAHQTGEPQAAIERICRAIALEAHHAAYHANLGEVHRAQGALDLARGCFLRALELSPDFTPAMLNLGLTLAADGDPGGARHWFEQALRRNPTDRAALNALGEVLRAQGLLADAEVAYRQSLALASDDFDTSYELGVTLVAQQRAEEGAELIERSMAHRQPTAQAYYNLGRAYQLRGRAADAIALFSQGLHCEADSPELWLALAAALEECCQLDDAAACYGRVLQLRFRGVGPRHSLGRVYQAQGQLDKAEACYRQVLADDYAFGPAHYDLGTILLGRGDFAAGWEEYEWRWHTTVEPRQFAQPAWDGSPLASRTILVHAEQGLGDTLLYLRYVSLLERDGARVIVAVQPSLVPLIRGSHGGEVVPLGSPTSAFDVHAPLLSLPRLFRTRRDTIPAELPYLRADRARIALWQKRLAGITGFRVGIHWQGNPEYSFDALRSIPLVDFAPLAAVEGVTLVSLQQKNGVEQLPLARRRITIHELGNDVDVDGGPFVDTAAVMMNLDLVITSDTAAAHLAGALGVPVWLALSRAPEWRWMLDESTSPWYPSMRLFRQREWNEWSGVFQSMARRLSIRVGSRRTR
jgi:tetratricopeptide (TPR) repeat protein